MISFVATDFDGTIHHAEKRAVFAAGDNFNDLSMLDGAHAGMVAAPANAIPEVKATVLSAGGYVARRLCGHGILEALQHFS
ncbi:MAG: HAD hydrolase family protein [Verrucomicrobia bacterium]|nr:HAD hydrolase family protein [Verrucomicrobiota bacterium]